MAWKFPLLIITTFTFMFFVFNKQTSFNYHNQKRIPTSQNSLNNDLANALALIVKISNVNEVAPTFEQIKKSYAIQKVNELTPPQKIIFEICEAVLAHQGLVNRLQPIIEKNDVTSIAVITALKSIKQNISTQTPWLNYIYDFLFIENKSAKPIKSMSELQNHFARNIAPVASSVISMIEQINKQNPGLVSLESIKLSEIFNDKFSHLPQSTNQFHITTAHLKALQSHLQKFLGYGHYLSSYDLNDLPEVVEQIIKSSSKKAMFSQLGKRHPIEKSNLISPKDFYHVLSKNKFNKFLTFKDEEESPANLEQSRFFLIESAKTNIELHDLLQTNNFQLISNQKFMSSAFNNIKNKDRKWLEAELNFLSSNEVQTILHPISAELITVNPSKIWSEDQSDLKNNFPNGYHENKMTSENFLDLNYGKPVSWPDTSFGKVLPQANNKNLGYLTEGLILNPTSSFVGTWLEFFQ